MTHARAFFAGALALAVACTGLETGNSRTPTILSSALVVGPAPPVDAAGVTFGLTEARANIRRIDFELPSGVTCADVAALDAATLPFCEGDTVRIEGPFIVDLLTGQATPAIPSISVPPGLYRRVEVRFDEADPDDGLVQPGNPLADNTLVAAGQVPIDGVQTPFDLVLDFSEEARFENPGGLALAEGPQAILLRLDASAWFADLPLSECAEDGDLPSSGGVVHIRDGDGSCSDVEGAIRDAIEASGELADDDD